jgi:hypothetical protein
MYRLTIFVFAVACVAFLLACAPPKEPGAVAQLQDENDARMYPNRRVPEEPSAVAQLQAAINKETVEADLDGALAQFRAIVTKYEKTDRAVTAMALVHIGECYRKKGDAESRRVFEQVERDYPDQKEAVSRARAGLAGPGGRGEMTAVSVWNDAPPPGAFNIAGDQPLLPYRSNRSGDLMLRNLTTGESDNLTNIGPGERGKVLGSGLISADGKMVAYDWSTLVTTDGATISLSAVDEDRKEIRTIGSDGAGMKIHISGKSTSVPGIVAISPDHRTLLVSAWAAASASTPAHPILQRLSLIDGTLTPFANGFWSNAASFSTDGRFVALEGAPEGAKPVSRGLYVANADGTNLRRLLDEPVFTPRWTADGKWIAFKAERTANQPALWAIPAAGGEPRLLKQEPSINGLYGFTRDGSLFYSAGKSLTDIQLARLDSATHALTGQARRFIDTFAGQNDDLKFSPDGKWMAWRSRRKDGYVLVVRATIGGEERVLYHLAGVGGYAWLPDSSALLVRRRAGDMSGLQRIDVPDGHVTELDWGAFPPGMPVVTEGGKSLLWSRCNSVGCELARIDTQTKTEAIEPMGGFVERGPSVLSPDGKWLAIVGRTPSTTIFSLFVRPAAAGGKLVERVHGIVRSTGTPTFVFTPDSKQVIYQAEAPLNQLRIVPVDSGPSVSTRIIGQYPSFHPDGRLTYTQTTGSPGVVMLRNPPLN